MVNFTLTYEQQAMKDLARDFGEREVRPAAIELEKNPDPEKCWSWELLDKAGETGLTNLAVSEKVGGYGADWLTIALVTEELCTYDAGFGITLLQGRWKVPKMLQELWTEVHDAKFMGEFVQDPRYLFSAAITEPEGGGSDNFLPFLDPKGGVKLKAEKKGDYVVLNGIKHFITVGGRARLYAIFARTDNNQPINQGVTTFMVPAETPGFRIGRIHDKLGVRLMSNAELIFEDCRVPLENQVGAWNDGLAVVGRVMPVVNICDGAAILGVARAIFEQTLQYAKTRVQGGSPIIEHQAMRLLLAEMWSNIEAGRALLWKSAWTVDQFVATKDMEFWHPNLFKVPKLFISDTAVEVAMKALEIFAGYGIMKDVGLEKLVRDALSLHHVDGPNTIIKLAMGTILSRL